MFSIEINGIDNIVNKLNNIVSNENTKMELFLSRLRNVGFEIARAEFMLADYTGVNDVTVRFEDDKNGFTLIAEGKNVAFIEFGTGINHPEYGADLPEGIVRHGEYGLKRGSNPKGWFYIGEQGTNGYKPTKKKNPPPNLWWTDGVDPARAMYKASKEMKNQISNIAREVFS